MMNGLMARSRRRQRNPDLIGGIKVTRFLSLQSTNMNCNKSKYESKFTNSSFFVPERRSWHTHTLLRKFSKILIYLQIVRASEEYEKCFSFLVSAAAYFHCHTTRVLYSTTSLSPLFGTNRMMNCSLEKKKFANIFNLVVNKIYKIICVVKFPAPKQLYQCPSIQVAALLSTCFVSFRSTLQTTSRRKTHGTAPSKIFSDKLNAEGNRIPSLRFGLGALGIDPDSWGQQHRQDRHWVG